MVSVLAFVSDDPSSNPAESAVLILSNCLTRTKNQKRGREWPIFKASFTSLILQSLQAVFGWMNFVIWSLRRKVSLLSLFCDATMNKEIASDDRIKRTKAFFLLNLGDGILHIKGRAPIFSNKRPTSFIEFHFKAHSHREYFIYALQLAVWEVNNIFCRI